MTTKDMFIAPAWVDSAACRLLDEPAKDAFFDPPRYLEAARVCAKCPVRSECLDHALRADEEHGVWGGLRPDERQRIVRGDQVRCAYCGRKHRRAGSMFCCRDCADHAQKTARSTR